MKPLLQSQIHRLRAQIESAMVGATPSLQMSVFLRGDNTLRLKLGDAATYFDLASLTKIIFTTSRLMQLCENGSLSVDEPVVKYLPWFQSPQTSVRQLLTHSAGFRRWAPFYKDLNFTLTFGERWMQLQLQLRDERMTTPVEKAEYSDIDYLLLGAILESVEHRPLGEIWRDLSGSLHNERLHFCVENKPLYPRKLYAPTESCPWRKRVLQGEVHDENTWALGGLAPHAGLFGRLEDVENWALRLRASYRGEKDAFVDTKVARQFLRRQVEPKLGDWGLGFMMPTAGSSSSGQYFSPLSFGHTGFTGTSYWWDVEQDILVILLANRVHPTRENKLFVELRPQIHNWIIEQLNSRSG